jgi:mRNA deadenylase 3'-5' endonuclease subunit Ccr4
VTKGRFTLLSYNLLADLYATVGWGPRRHFVWNWLRRLRVCGGGGGGCGGGRVRD